MLSSRMQAPPPLPMAPEEVPAVTPLPGARPMASAEDNVRPSVSALEKAGFEIVPASLDQFRPAGPYTIMRGPDGYVALIPLAPEERRQPNAQPAPGVNPA